MTAERGSAAVEVAMVLPIVLLVAFAAVEIAVVAHRQLEVTHAAREGAREAAANPNPAAATAAVGRALGDLADSARISVSRDHVVGGTAVVEIVLPHAVASPLFGGWPVAVVGRAAMRVEQ